MNNFVVVICRDMPIIYNKDCFEIQNSNTIYKLIKRATDPSTSSATCFTQDGGSKNVSPVQKYGFTEPGLSQALSHRAPRYIEQIPRIQVIELNAEMFRYSL